MDELARFNRERWNALVEAGVEYSLPWLDLTPEVARDRIDPDGLLGDLKGKSVLCLATGGGQQSAAFALLGANVAVLDLSDAQLAQDRRAAEHYGHSIRTEHSDMRDLSRFAARSFDVVYQGFSINFVPDVRQVFGGVARVLRSGGQYVLQVSNPHRYSLRDEVWRDGYALVRPYRDGEVVFEDPDWEFQRDDGSTARISGPREFNHTWATVMNGLADHGFVIRHVKEFKNRVADPEIGSWEHFLSVLPFIITFFTVYQPEAFVTYP
jgi:SAM-dependent methyltransferase